jgi:photosystem II stability/assembly factor-like uncharacterized protein
MVIGKEEGVALLRTSDGGAHWVSEKLPADVGSLSAIACPAKSICEAVGQRPVPRGLHAASTPDDIAIRTTNGGDSWVTTSIPGTIGASLQSIACPTVSVCEVVGVGPAGQHHSNAASTAADAVAVRTTDRGANWDDQALPAGVGNLYDVSCPSPSACVAVGYSQTEYAVVVRFA